MNNISMKLCCLIFDTCKISFTFSQACLYQSMQKCVWTPDILPMQDILCISCIHGRGYVCVCVYAECVREWLCERERERPLLSAATQCVTELFRFIEKVPPFSTTNLCKESREWVGGTLTKSICVKEALVA